MKAATVVWYDVKRFREVTLVLAEHSLVHKWQNSAPETGSGMAVHVSAFFAWQSLSKVKVNAYKRPDSTKFNFISPKLTCQS